MARPQEFQTADVLGQAMRLFWEKGYEATSLTDLLGATGLSKSSLYASFGGKHDLFLAAFDAYRADRARDMNHILSQGPARDAIKAFFRTIVGDMRAPGGGSGCMSINQAVELAPHDPEVQQRVKDDFQRIEDALTAAIERGGHDGTMIGTIPARDLARLLVLGFPGLQIMARAGLDERAEHALGQLLALLD